MKLLDYFAREDTKTPYALAKYLNINAANVYGWLKSGRPVPVAHCPKLKSLLMVQLPVRNFCQASIGQKCGTFTDAETAEENKFNKS